MQPVQNLLGYNFTKKELLKEALTHPSISKQENSGAKSFNYERLEFLGDSVLSLVIAEMLLNNYPDEKEGHLAKRHAALVRGEALTAVAASLKLGDFIYMTHGEEYMGGRSNSSNMENVLEAIIGAIYMDGGLKAAQDFIVRNWTALMEGMKEPPRDSKTALQEWAQGRGLPIPVYEIVKTSGPSHNPDFEVSVNVKGLDVVTASGSSKKKAEKEAAQKLLEIIIKQENND